MDANDRRLIGYVELAALAARRGQADGCVRFVILAGVAACRAGLPQIADRCRAAVARLNSRHLVTNHDTFAVALRDPDFEPLLKSLERQCPWEQSEHVLAELEIGLEAADREELLERVNGLLDQVDGCQ